MPERHVPLLDEVANLFARAKAAEANPPRKHHLVPSSYLRSWERDGKLRVTDLERGSSWLTPAKKALRDTDFYELSGEGLDTDAVPPWLMETTLGRLEDEAVPALARLVAKPESLSSEDRFFVSNLLAFQYTRSRGIREEMKFLANEVFKATYGALTADGVRAELTRRSVDPTPERVDGSLRFLEDVQRGRAWVEPQKAQLVHQAAAHAVQLAEYLFTRVWIVYSVPPLLVTTDQPVVAIHGPGGSREHRAGLGTAGVVVFPLNPSHLLAMVHTRLAADWGLSAEPDRIYLDQLTSFESLEVAHELVAHTDRYVVEVPNRSLGSRLNVGPLAPPADFDEVARRPQGAGQASLMRLSKRNRWATAAVVPPWPVPRWWRASSDHAG